VIAYLLHSVRTALGASFVPQWPHRGLDLGFISRMKYAVLTLRRMGRMFFVAPRFEDGRPLLRDDESSVVRRKKKTKKK
jgi:hypothetical protein